MMLNIKHICKLFFCLDFVFNKLFQIKTTIFFWLWFQVSSFSGLNVKLCSTYCRTESETPATSYRVPVFVSMEDRHFNKSNLEDDGKSYWLIRLWWHPSGSPWGSMCPMSMQWSWEGEWAKPASPELWMEGKGGEVWIRTHGKSAAHIQTHTHTKAVVWGQACCEGGCGWVELFACVSFWRGCLRGLLLERGELGIYQTTSLSRSLPSSASMRPRCDESEYSLWCIIITAQFCLFICWICFLISHRSIDHLRHCGLGNNKNSHWAVT